MITCISAEPLVTCEVVETSLKVTIDASAAEAGLEFEVTVTLVDVDDEPESTIYELKIAIVEPESDEEEIEEEEKAPAFAGVVIDDLEVDEDSKKQDFVIEFVPIPPRLSLRDVSAKGIVTITCSKELLVPNDYNETITPDVLQLSLKPDPSQDESKLAFAWQWVSFEPTLLTLQLVFENPVWVSKGYSLD